MITDTARDTAPDTRSARALTQREIDGILDQMERTRPKDPWPDAHRSTDRGSRPLLDDLGYLRFERPFDG